MSCLSVSSWSLRRALGPRYRQAAGGSTRLLPDGDQVGELSLLEVPARIAERGIPTLEICHFHFPSVGPGFLDDLRGSIRGAGTTLFSILIDGGDITHPDPETRARETAWIRDWIVIASRCGASHARVIAGDAEVPAGDGEGLLRMSAEALTALAGFGRDW